MAGVYFHIPFCKQACHYCDFHFRIGLKDEEAMSMAMLEELEMESHFPFEASLDSVYFGGGTPSLLTPERIETFLNACDRLFGIDKEAEITLEANPDDLDLERIRAYRSLGVDRLSIGVQSFDDGLLEHFGRPHSGKEAERCLKRAAEAGLRSYSADLIFGMPGYGRSILEQDLQLMIQLGVPHLSTYGLTIEPNTALGRWVEQGKIPAPDEEEMKIAYERIMERLEKEGFEHYEISNFARAGHRAVHNRSYWTGEPYLGIGPSAHSFDGADRWWNVPKNARYIRGIQQGEPEREHETYDPVDRANERLMTRLRTKEGLDPAELSKFGVELWEIRGESIRKCLEDGTLFQDEERLRLTQKGKLLADRICERMFILKDDRGVPSR